MNWASERVCQATLSADLRTALVETLVRMQTALESAGVVFIPADHAGGPGVRLREAPARTKRKLSTLIQK
jgi:hypothetical protein